MEETVEERVHNMICDYITKRIRKNLRVYCDMKIIGDMRIEKDVKMVLNEALDIIPYNLTVTERSI